MDDLRNQVEDSLGVDITKATLLKAIRMAERKQRMIFRKTSRTEVLQKEYLSQLVIECARGLMLTKITVGAMSQVSDNMEKEYRSISGTSTPTQSIL